MAERSVDRETFLERIALGTQERTGIGAPRPQAPSMPWPFSSIRRRLCPATGLVERIRIWLVPLVLLDFTFLPMWHIGSFPWKPGYVVLVLAFPLYARSLSPELLKSARPFVILFGVLFGATLLGSVVFQAQTGVALSGETLRLLLVYALVPLAFVAGLADRRRWHGYLPWIMAAFLILNLVLEADLNRARHPTLENEAIGYHANPGAVSQVLVGFYGVERNLKDPPYHSRAFGVFQNPNITTLSMTMLLLFLVAGLKRGFVRPGRYTLVGAVWLALVCALLMTSRNQFAAIGLVSAAGLVALGWKAGARAAVVLATLMILTFVAGYGLRDRAYATFGYEPTSALMRRY